MYDYVIVGAGSAGCVLAARLSEDRTVRVLLLEAGPPDDAGEIKVPAAFPFLFKTAYDWDYTTEPQEGLGGRSIYWPRGRMLGGSASMNAMIYIRGNRLDWDTWRDSHGCTGWGYSEVLPYFLRAEDNCRGASPYHGDSGPLQVEEQRYTHRLTAAFIEAARACGWHHNEDFNGPVQDGVGRYQVTQSKGSRWSTADGYLRPATSRPNLTVRTDALVTKVLLQRGRAIGVRYLHHGAEHSALVQREVVLCGGAVNSPQLLMLSGVGPADHLRRSGIDVAVDLPAVGAGLQDHPTVPAMWFTPRVRNVWEMATVTNLIRWKLFKRGPYASSMAEAGAFGRSRSELPAPDVQFHAVALPVMKQGLSEPPTRAFTILVTAVNVASRGRIWLRSADPRHKPAIDPAYYTDASDLDTMLAGVAMAREIAAHPPLTKLLEGEFAPGSSVRESADVKAWISCATETLFHPVGTCAMGGSQEAVCDPELRVRGVERLRVVDASVMPFVPRGNTNAPTIAIAERAADLLTGRPALDPAIADRAPVGQRPPAVPGPPGGAGTR